MSRHDEDIAADYADWSGFDEDDSDGVCEHDCDDVCMLEGCNHSHCFACGECGCAGYCDDYQTYNLRPAETGGQPAPKEG